MSASVVCITRNSSFDAAMPSGPVPLTCRASAARMTAAPLAAAPPAPRATVPLLPAAAPGSSELLRQPASAHPAPTAALARAPAGLAPIVTQPPPPPSSECDAQALADQLEDLLVFTRTPHQAPEDPALLVRSPPAEAGRVRAAVAEDLSAGDLSAPAPPPSPAASTPHAEDGGVTTPRAPPAATGCAGGALPHLSPVSQLALSEGGSLAEMLRGPRPLRENALELTRSPCIQPAFSQDLAPVLGMLDDVVAAAAAAATAAAQPAGPAAAPAAVPTPAAAPALGMRAPPGVEAHPLSPTCAVGPLSPSKSSGAMIQLCNLHKAEWHRAHSCSDDDNEYGSDYDSDSSLDTTSSGDTREGSIESALARRSRFSAGRAVAVTPAVPLAVPMAVEGGEEGEGGSIPHDAVMTPEGVRRVMGTGSQISLALASAATISLPAVEALPESLGGGGSEEESMEICIHPAAAIGAPLSVPAFATLSRPPSLGALATPFALAGGRGGGLGAALGGGAAAAAAAAAAMAPGPFHPATTSPAFARFLGMLRSSSTEFEAEGRVLRLRRYLRADVAPAVLDSVLEALAQNTRVEALYIQNFEDGMRDAQLDRLCEVLRRGRIWAVNVGENFGISRQAWECFAACLPHTAVAHLFVSERHLEGSDLKTRMRDAIRQNRRAAPPRDPAVVVHVGNMWWNPRLPAGAPGSDAGDNSSRGGGLPDIHVGSKRLSSELEEGMEGAAVSSSPLLRRTATQRVGFRGSLVAGASRATLLRPRPPKPREILLAAGAGGGAPHGSGALAHGGGLPAAVTMVTRARAGVIVGSPGVNVAEAGGGADDDDEDYHVEDDAPLSDDDLDEDVDFFGNRLRHGRSGRHGGAAPARASRRLQERGYPIVPAGPLAAEHLAGPPAGSPASPARSSAPAPKRHRGETSRDSSSGEGEAVSYRPAAPAPAAPRRPSGGSRAGGARGGSSKRSGGGARGAARGGGGEQKGRPSFGELVESGFMRPGPYVFTVGTQEVSAVIEDDGAIRYGASRFRAISKFALVVLRERNPTRQSCDGWKEVAWNGEKLDLLRLRLQQYLRQQARRMGAPAAA